MNDRPTDPPTEPMVSTAPHLPRQPPTCAACGLTDWTVSVTEPDGRKLHVACWKGEQARTR